MTRYEALARELLAMAKAPGVGVTDTMALLHVAQFVLDLEPNEEVDDDDKE